MNKKFKFLTVLLALVMTLGVFAPLGARAAAATETKTVTLHKLLMTKAELDAWKSNEVEENGYDATQDLKGLNEILAKMQKKEVSEIEGVYFVLKFADGANKGKYVKRGVDALTPADPIEATDDIEEAVGGLTTATGLVFKTSKLKGNFIIDEVSEKSTYENDGAKLTGSKAVPVEITLPLVNNNGIVENAHVYPKNIEDKPKIDKNFAKEHGLT
ncbi:MAG: pilin N-terminal domain-containing protein, partial [Ezakiella sp.]